MENAVNCVLKLRFMAVGLFSCNNLHMYMFFQQVDSKEEILKSLIWINITAKSKRLCSQSWSWVSNKIKGIAQ